MNFLLKKKRSGRFIDSLEAANNISIDRCIAIHRAKSFELHAFSNASEKAYGSSIYLKSISTLGEVKVCLVTSKSRVSPLKQISIPRLELCGAVFATKLKKVKEALNLQITAVHFWLDSTIVISWIHRESRELKTFVANRVSKIHQLSSHDQFIENCRSKVKERGPLTTSEDDKGILRVGGRLEKASIPYSQKHPAILAENSKIKPLAENNKGNSGSLEIMEYRLSEYSLTERKVDDREGQCNVWYDGNCRGGFYTSLQLAFRARR
ncbi:integrase_H2C2 domain-containing protein [Trichonephila clavipes]|uniref:Integrase_H2C2 domain-containing protein n=1 Tax=Trichonephila clavipes TaxID=2585209 RepID=A0A8X6VR19_TRICX|nr:integrase_H2C2 domain-containing protein [Trichonephila clavipes]